MVKGWIRNVVGVVIGIAVVVGLYKLLLEGTSWHDAGASIRSAFVQIGELINGLRGK